MAQTSSPVMCVKGLDIGQNADMQMSLGVFSM